MDEDKIVKAIEDSFTVERQTEDGDLETINVPAAMHDLCCLVNKVAEAITGGNMTHQEGIPGSVTESIAGLAHSAQNIADAINNVAAAIDRAVTATTTQPRSPAVK